MKEYQQIQILELQIFKLDHTKFVKNEKKQGACISFYGI